MRGGAEVARWAHNPKARGSNPLPATTTESSSFLMGILFFASSESLMNACFAENRALIFEVRYCLFWVSRTKPSGNTNFCILRLMSRLPDSQYLLTFCENSIAFSTLISKLGISKPVPSNFAFKEEIWVSNLVPTISSKMCRSITQ